MKIFDRHDSEIGFGVRRINEDLWFKQQQKLLLWLVNTKEGRDLMCIEQNFPPILQITKNYIKGFIGFDYKDRAQYISQARVGAKWANVIRYRWKEFQKAAQWYYINEVANRIIFNPVAQVPSRINYVVTTAFPDPDPETTTTDGAVTHEQANQTWATLVAGAGTTATPASGEIHAARFTAGTTSGLWTDLVRSIFLFDVSAGIPDTDAISDTTLDIDGGTAKDDPNGNTPNINVYSSAPATDTNVVAGDFDSLGSTEFATSLTYASWTINVYNTFTFNSTGRDNVSKTGITKLGLRNASYDVANSAPTWGSGSVTKMNCQSADAAGTADDPLLTVTHAAASTFIPKVIMM